MVGIGLTGDHGVLAVLGVAAVVCCAMGIAGDMMQDLKVGHILGGTPAAMERGELIAARFDERVPGRMQQGSAEHGERNRILANTFVENACGVHLWWDADEGLTKLPWSSR
mgnify:CR=1 FL=1